MIERQLIEKAAEKDPDAFSELMQSCLQEMYRVALAILMNDEDAADAIGDSILTCWEKIGTLRNVEYFKTWLIRIVINRSRDILRKNRRYTDMEELPEEAAGEEPNWELKEALGKLEEKYRVPIVLYYFEGYSTKEIAEILKLPLSTVQTRLARARDALKKYMQGNDL